MTQETQVLDRRRWKRQMPLVLVSLFLFLVAVLIPVHVVASLKIFKTNEK
jgi:hypothetical protein